MANAKGCTIVVCAAQGCRTPLHEHLLAELRQVVRASRFGMLVVSGCGLGAVTCRMRPSAPVLAVQPCDAQRRPVGPMVRVGPVRGPRDVGAITAWLRVGRLDPAELPAGLTVTHRSMRHAVAN